MTGQVQLTPTQLRVYEFLKEFIVERGMAPTLGEICGHFGYRSPNGATCHLKALASKGYITHRTGT